MTLQLRDTWAPCPNAIGASIITKELVVFQSATSVENWVTALKTVGVRETETEMETALVLETTVGTVMAMVTGLGMKLDETKDASVVEAMNIS